MNKTRLLLVYLLAVFLGVITGLVGSYFKLSIDYLTQALHQLNSILANYGIPEQVISVIITMAMVFIAWFLVYQIAPEAAGSGVQEIEGVLLHQRPIYWRRLLPVKFIGGVLAIAAKLVVGREGPTIQMGGNLGEMLGEWFRLHRRRRDTLIAAGAAAGLATAFNAPLAGILFVIEEMRDQFDFSFTNFKTVAICCVVATITMRLILGSGPAIPMNVFITPDIHSLILFFLLGLLVGCVGYLFNKLLMFCLRLKNRWSVRDQIIYVLLVSALIGFLAVSHPYWVGGGYEIIESSLSYMPTTSVLFMVFFIRFALTMLSYSTGVPGGIFAPMLALGTLIGLFGYGLFNFFIVDLTIQPGMFAVAGMGALFSAVVRAPITGIVLVVEMTQNYSLILPLMVSCLTATMIMQFTQNTAIYTQLLRYVLRNSESSPSLSRNSPNGLRKNG